MTKLEYGLGFRAKHYSRIVEEGPTAADFYEVISENFMTVGGRPRRFLAGLRERYPVAAHGVSLSIAGPDPLDKTYLTALREFVRTLRPAYVSDHLCWTGRAHHNAHDLLPVPFTETSLAHVATRVAAVQEFLDCRLYLENPSAYVAFNGDTMDEAAYLAELVRRTGCGLLLDINNLFVNTMNLAYDPVRYLSSLPPDSVGYFHLAGHAVNPDVRIDTHDDHVCPEVWSLYKVAAKLFPHAPTLVEWDDNIPPFEELEAEMNLARDHRGLALSTELGVLISSAQASIAAATKTGADSSSRPASHEDNLTTTQDSFLAMTVQTDNITAGDQRLAMLASNLPVSSLRGINVYNNAYFFRIRDVLMDELTTLAGLLGKPAFEQMLVHYLLQHPSTHCDIKYIGRHLPQFLSTYDCQANGHDPKALAAVAEFELARFELYDIFEGSEALLLETLGSRDDATWPDATFTFRPIVKVLSLHYAVTDVWDAAQAEAELTSPCPEEQHLLVFRHDEDVYHTALSSPAARAFRSIASGERFESVCAEFAAASPGQHSPDDAVGAVVKLLAEWTTLGLVQA